MGRRPTTILSLLRGFAAALMITVVTIASLASTVASLSSAASGQTLTAELAGNRTNVPKPCQKGVLPGAVNTCPLAAFSLNSLPADQPAAKTPDPAVHPLRWHIADARLTAQCGASSPYRPPCHLI